MKKILILFILLQHTAFGQQSLQLWYKQPAGKWEEALPVGNGRLGAMVFGRTNTELLQINESSVWAGTKFNDANPRALGMLDSIRQLLFAGKNEEAEKLAQASFVAVAGENFDQVARSFRSYQTLMNVNLDYGLAATDTYKRSLDLNSGIATTTFSSNGVEYKQEVLASAPDNVIAVRITASKPGALQLFISADRPNPADTSSRFTDCVVKPAGNNTLVLTGRINDKDNPARGPLGLHMRFSGMVKAVPQGGTIAARGPGLQVKNATALTIYIQGATNYNAQKQDVDDGAAIASGRCAKLMLAASARSYAQLLANHLKEFQPPMQKVTLQLSDPAAPDDLATDERLQAVKAGKEDLHLVSLYFQYGRYLLLSSSRRPGTLPANLQGIWSRHIDAPWQADFHTNINLQMNYWPAEVTNLSQTTAPLIDFLDYIRPQGRMTAKKMYNARGWVFHHCTDAFGKTGVQNNAAWGTFPMAASWMCLHLWEHYAFTLDYAFLKTRAYPIMKEHAQFVEDFLVKSPEGFLVASPGSSPENKYRHPVTGKGVGMTYGVTMDNQILREFLNKCIAAATALRTDSADIERWKQIVSGLPPTRTGKDGRILEWMQEYDEVEQGHRHISHLFGLHPGSQITEQTPSLFEGALRTLEGRLSKGGGHTGWSRAWIINFYARLKQADSVRNHLQALFAKSTLPNLFDNHPPFQIDGNFGGTAGIAEALLQSHGDYVEVLPALPASWSSGKVTGLCARGGFELDISWKDGILSGLVLRSTTGRNIVLKYRQHLLPLSVERGKSVDVPVHQLL
ncbi:glycoside hydrolase family 95 protein [Chitinophaga lutea]